MNYALLNLYRPGDQFHLACVIIDETDDLRPYYRERPLVHCHADLSRSSTYMSGSPKLPRHLTGLGSSASIHAGAVHLRLVGGFCGCSA